MKLKNMALSGMIARKIMVVPCMVNSWLYVSGRRNVLFGDPSWIRSRMRLDAADQEEDEGGRAVEDPDALVVDRGEPAPQTGRLRVARGGVRPLLVECGGCHMPCYW